MSNASQWAGSFSHDLPVYSLTADQIDELAALFGVEPQDVRRIPHSYSPEYEAIAIRFIRGINVPVALASYLNHEFYTPPPYTDLDNLHYSPNSYAYVADTEFGEALVLTISDRSDKFLRRLSDKAAELRYVALHPEILFLMRPNISYQTAKSNFEKGLRPAL